MTREEAKRVKSDFVNMSQTYNGYEITDMWNMMCDQLFDSMQFPIRNMQIHAEAPMPIVHKIKNETCGMEPFDMHHGLIATEDNKYSGLKAEYYLRTFNDIQKQNEKE